MAEYRSVILHGSNGLILLKLDKGAANCTVAINEEEDDDDDNEVPVLLVLGECVL